jgi:DnaJ-domain-containing protein 1
LRESLGRGGTQPHAEGRAWQRFGFDDPMELLGDKATLNPGAERVARPQRRLPASERRALEILEAQDTQSKSEIRKQYKALVKDLHPDMNGGKRDDEARLAEVVWAWEQIKASRSFRD